MAKRYCPRLVDLARAVEADGLQGRLGRGTQKARSVDEEAQGLQEVVAWEGLLQNRAHRTGCHRLMRTLRLSLSPESKMTFPSTSSAPTSHNTGNFGLLFAHIEHIAHTSTMSIDRMRRMRQRHSRAKLLSRAVQ